MIAVRREFGIGTSGQRCKPVGEFAGHRFDYVVTVCDNARDTCPVFPAGAARLHWSYEDPAALIGPLAERVAEFRRIRDQIHEKVESFLRDQAPGGPSDQE